MEAEYWLKVFYKQAPEQFEQISLRWYAYMSLIAAST